MMAQFTKEKGDAIHHFCLLTDNIEDDVEALKQRGSKAGSNAQDRFARQKDCFHQTQRFKTGLRLNYLNPKRRKNQNEETK